MRANIRFAWMAVSVAALASGARALPDPAYAVSETAAGPTGADTLDRYGGRVSGALRPSNPAQTGPSAPVRLLTWAGKASAKPPASPPAASAGPGVQPTAQNTPPARLWRPPAPSAGAPATLYDAPPKPAAAASAAAQPPAPGAWPRRQAVEGGPRFYSVHRDYGIEPDAIPLAPQFFGPTADLSTPPSDPLVKRVTTASGQTRTVEVASGDQTSQ